MTQYIESKELLEMKEQMALLKQKLDNEKIINEQLMRRVMNMKSQRLQKGTIIKCMALLLMYPYFLFIIPNYFGFSIGFGTFVCVAMTISIASYIYIYYHFRPDNFINKNLIEMQKATIKLKKRYSYILIYISIPFLLIFSIWYTYDVSHIYEGTDLFINLSLMLIILITTTIIGIIKYNKIQRTADEILSQIEELEKENKIN